VTLIARLLELIEKLLYCFIKLLKWLIGSARVDSDGDVEGRRPGGTDGADSTVRAL
jgi:hypothetical protein